MRILIPNTDKKIHRAIGIKYKYIPSFCYLSLQSNKHLWDFGNASGIPLAQFSTARSFHCACSYAGMKDDHTKMFTALFGYKFHIVHSAISNNCNVTNKRTLLVLFVRYWQLVFWLPLVVRGGAESLKGSHRLGDRLIFLKTSSMPHSLKTTYRLIPLSARSISLDSTFKRVCFHYFYLREVCAHLNSTRCHVTHFSSIQFLLHHACTVQWPWMELDGVYT